MHATSSSPSRVILDNFYARRLSLHPVKSGSSFKQNALCSISPISDLLRLFPTDDCSFIPVTISGDRVDVIRIFVLLR